MNELRKQIADLQAQMATQRTPNRQSESAARRHGTTTQVQATPADSDTSEPPRHSGTKNNRPRPWYCFTCGEDGHMTTYCENAPNQAKVEEKKRQLRHVQAKWDRQNNVAPSSKETYHPLN